MGTPHCKKISYLRNDGDFLGLLWICYAVASRFDYLPAGHNGNRNVDWRLIIFVCLRAEDQWAFAIDHTDQKDQNIEKENEEKETKESSDNSSTCRDSEARKERF